MLKNKHLMFSKKPLHKDKKTTKEKVSKEEFLFIKLLKEKYIPTIREELESGLGRKPTKTEILEDFRLFIEEARSTGLIDQLLRDFFQEEKKASREPRARPSS